MYVGAAETDKLREVQQERDGRKKFSEKQREENKGSMRKYGERQGDVW